MTYSKQPYYIVKLNQRISDAFHMKQKAFGESDINKFRLQIKVADEKLNEAIQLRKEIKKGMRKYMTKHEFVQAFR